MQTKEPIYEPLPNTDFMLVADVPTNKGHLVTFFVADNQKRRDLLAACQYERRSANQSL